jgi:hypothetical protein
VLNLVADARIVAAAHRIDAIFWELNLRVADPVNISETPSRVGY